ncbi:unnamed protein product [Rhodiola kirilowii]
MGMKQWQYPTPTYKTMETYWDSDDDALGPRCGHTLTVVATTKTRGPNLFCSAALLRLRAELPLLRSEYVNSIPALSMTI